MKCPACEKEMQQIGLNDKDKPSFACDNPECPAYVDLQKWGFKRGA